MGSFIDYDNKACRIIILKKKKKEKKKRKWGGDGGSAMTAIACTHELS